jgi:hypothetical protein
MDCLADDELALVSGGFYRDRPACHVYQGLGVLGGAAVGAAISGPFAPGGAMIGGMVGFVGSSMTFDACDVVTMENVTQAPGFIQGIDQPVATDDFALFSPAAAVP